MPATSALGALRMAARYSGRETMGVRRTIMVACALACAFGAANANQVRLNRCGLALTFNDDFDRVSWDDPRTPAQGGSWKTWYRNDHDPYNLHNRTLPGNKEMQVYGDPAYFAHVAPDEDIGFMPVSAQGGMLLLRAEPAPVALRPRLWDREYISGMITNWGNFAQTYGVFELRAKLPAGKGMWPAFWLLPADGTWPPEVDVFEVLGDKPNELNIGYLRDHRNGKLLGDHVAVQAPDLTADFHTYGFEWRRDVMIFYLDDVELRRWPTPATMHKPMFMIINLAVGGKWPGAPDAATKFPATMEVDWVRAYKRNRAC